MDPRLFNAALGVIGELLPRAPQYVNVVPAPQHTENLFGPIEEVAGKRLQLLERNRDGDCLCLFRGCRGVNIVDVDRRDIQRAKESATV
jgi:hypothetical protein